MKNLIEDREFHFKELFFKIHSLILEILPDINYSFYFKDGGMIYGARQFGYDGWGVLALAAYRNWVSLMFMRGTQLKDPEGVLEGTGKKMRQIKLRSPEELSELKNKLEKLIKEALTLMDP